MLVTGGCGFIGSHFVRVLLNQPEVDVTNIDKLTYAAHPELNNAFNQYANYRFKQIDIADKQALEAVFDRHYDAIINFAAETHVDRSIDNADVFLQTNIIGTYHLLLAVLEGKASKMVQVSTDEVYGALHPDEPPFTEHHPLSPNNPYSASKASADLLVRSFYKTYKLPLLITRCSNNYGPYQHSEKLLPKVIKSALQNNKIPIYGHGQQIRDWLYVEDHCDAIYRVLNEGVPGEIYNIGGQNEQTNLAMVERIVSYLQNSKDLIMHVKDRPGHDERYGIDSTKIRKELNWQPKVSLSVGLKRTIDWYLQSNKGLEIHSDD